MQNVVVFRQPKFKPLPGELTPAVINGATLPVKVEAAKRAIAACCDLSELLTWKDKLAALAAAAKMARMPEMARDVNRVHKEAIFRMGEILLQYNDTPVRKNKPKGCTEKSERRTAAAAAGISHHTAIDASRIARAPLVIKESILKDDSIPASPRQMAQRTPRLSSTSTRGLAMAYSPAAAFLFKGPRSIPGLSGGGGLSQSAHLLKNLNLASINFFQLTPAEKQRARKLVVEMQEILDEIDRRLGPT